MWGPSITASDDNNLLLTSSRASRNKTLARAALVSFAWVVSVLSFSTAPSALKLSPHGGFFTLVVRKTLAPCEGGFATFVPKWRAPGFIHAINVAAVSIVTYGYPNITADALFDGSTREGEAAASSTQVFLVIDVDPESSYGHWQLENAVFLREWESIQATHSTARLVIGNKRTYKQLTFELYKVPYEKVILLKDLPPLNYCIFLPKTSLGDPATDSVVLLERWNAHVKFIQCSSGLNVQTTIYNRESHSTPLDGELGPIVPTSVLVMPRGRKENLRVNDRVYPGFDVVAQWAESNGGRTLYVDNVTDYRIQVRAIASARVIVLPEGSAFHASGGLAAHAVIIVVGTRLFDIQRSNPKVVDLVNNVRHGCMQTCNEVVFVPDADHALPTIMERFAKEVTET
jgi:hypothetical protein